MSKKKSGKKAHLEKTRHLSRSWDDFMGEELADPTRAQAYLEVAIEEFRESGNAEAFLEALGQLAKARGGMSQIARKTGLNRESLYRTLSRHGNPQFRTVLGVIDALGMRVKIEPAEIRPS
jgi:probable addiction module antidote protein